MLHEQKETLTFQHSEEVKRLNEQLAEVKEKNKRKQNELSIQIHEAHTAHQQEVAVLKQNYDEIFHRLETELDAKKELANELQN